MTDGRRVEKLRTRSAFLSARFGLWTELPMEPPFGAPSRGATYRPHLQHTVFGVGWRAFRLVVLVFVQLSVKGPSSNSQDLGSFFSIIGR